MSEVDLDSVRWYSKRELAIHQLNRAIEMLLDERDAICAITLAGAAEELLGKLVEESGAVNALHERIDNFLKEGMLIGEEWRPKHFTQIANSARDALKHHGDGTDFPIIPEFAYEYVDRAIENLERLAYPFTSQVSRYLQEIRGA